MKEVKGNMLYMDCDALCITTNGFVKSNGECVMGKGIANQMYLAFPHLAKTLGRLIGTKGNQVHLLDTINNIDIVSYPTKPRQGIVNKDRSNVVKHMQHRFTSDSFIPGWAMVSDPELIIKSAHELVALADLKGWSTVLVPRMGCGAGELDWKDIKPLVSNILDKRFHICTYDIK